MKKHFIIISENKYYFANRYYNSERTMIGTHEFGEIKNDEMIYIRMSDGEQQQGKVGYHLLQLRDDVTPDLTNLFTVTQGVALAKSQVGKELLLLANKHIKNKVAAALIKTNQHAKSDWFTGKSFYINLSVDDCTKLSVINQGTIEYNDLNYTECWDNSRVRTKGRPSTMLSKIFEEKWFKDFEIEDKDIEEFTNIMNSLEPTTSLNIETDIVSAYDGRNYVEGGGSLQSSCMKYDNTLPFIEFYDMFDVKILVLRNELNKIVGRALLWYDVIMDGKKVNFMDRIYYTKDNQVEKFKSWARDNGFYYKLRQSYEDRMDFVNPQGEALHDVDCCVISDAFTEDVDLERLPYIDTFCFLACSDSNGVSLSNTRTKMIMKRHESTHIESFKLNDTDGCYSNSDSLQKSIFLKNGNEAEYYSSRRGRILTSVNQYSRLKHLEGKKVIDEDNSIVRCYDDSYMLRKETNTCSVTREFYPKRYVRLKGKTTVKGGFRSIKSRVITTTTGSLIDKNYSLEVTRINGKVEIYHRHEREFTKDVRGLLRVHEDIAGSVMFDNKWYYFTEEDREFANSLKLMQELRDKAPSVSLL